MSHLVVKILANEDGEQEIDPKWHLVTIGGGSEMALCTGEVFGYGEGSAVYEKKKVERGGITCETCLQMLKLYKSIKL